MRKIILLIAMLFICSGCGIKGYYIDYDKIIEESKLEIKTLLILRTIAYYVNFKGMGDTLEKLTFDINQLDEQGKREEAWRIWQNFICEVSGNYKKELIDFDSEIPKFCVQSYNETDALKSFTSINHLRSITKKFDESIKKIDDENDLIFKKIGLMQAFCSSGLPNEAECKPCKDIDSLDYVDIREQERLQQYNDTLQEAVFVGDVNKLIESYRVDLMNKSKENSPDQHWEIWSDAIFSLASANYLPEIQILNWEDNLKTIEKTAPIKIQRKIQLSRVMLRYRAQDYAGVISLVNEILDEIPAGDDEVTASMMFLRAESHKSIGNRDEAILDYLNAGRINPGMEISLINSKELVLKNRNDPEFFNYLIILAQIAINGENYKFAEEVFEILFASRNLAANKELFVSIWLFIQFQYKSQMSIGDFNQKWKETLADIVNENNSAIANTVKFVIISWSEKLFNFDKTISRNLDKTLKGEISNLLLWIGNAYLETEERNYNIAINRFLSAWRVDSDSNEALEMAAAGLIAASETDILPAETLKAFEDEFLGYYMANVKEMKNALDEFIESKEKSEDQVINMIRLSENYMWGLGLIIKLNAESKTKKHRDAAIWLRPGLALTHEFVNLMRCSVRKNRVDTTSLWGSVIKKENVLYYPDYARELAAIAAFNALMTNDFERARRFALISDQYQSLGNVDPITEIQLELVKSITSGEKD